MIAAAAVALALLAPAPARVQASADEFTLALSRAHVARGVVVLELVNYGEDDHDLVLRRVAPRARTFRMPVTRPGARAELEARLGPGRYRLWCTLAGHRAAGMSATLVVRP